MLSYDYKITYRPGRENLAIDTLSRKPKSPVFNYLHVPTVTIWGEVRKAYEGDPAIQTVAQLAKTQTEGPYIHNDRGYSTLKAK